MNKLALLHWFLSERQTAACKPVSTTFGIQVEQLDSNEPLYQNPSRSISSSPASFFKNSRRKVKQFFSCSHYIYFIALLFFCLFQYSFFCYFPFTEIRSSIHPPLLITAANWVTNDIGQWVTHCLSIVCPQNNN